MISKFQNHITTFHILTSWSSAYNARGEIMLSTWRQGTGNSPNAHLEKHVVTGALTSMFWRHLGARQILYLHDTWLTASSEETIKLHLSLTSSQLKCWAYQINKKKSIMFPQTSLSMSGWWVEESESGFFLSSQKILENVRSKALQFFRIILRKQTRSHFLFWLPFYSLVHLCGALLWCQRKSKKKRSTNWIV